MNNQNQPEESINFKEKLFFATAVFGLSMSFFLLAEFHTNPFRVPAFADIPLCYIYGNAYIAILLSELLKKTFLTRLLATIGFTVGILVSAYFLVVWIKFGWNAYIFPAEILGIKTVYTDFLLFAALLVLKIRRR